ncbi:MAG: DUF2330 domain-containing protein, partial [Myxococcota bacterium]
MKTSLLLATAAAVAALAVPSEARACGGTFCDTGPAAMPVDQKGENVLFVVEDGMVEAHVQIQYTGNPEQFAWIVPVMAAPEIEVGSDLLFQAALTATVPTFTLNTRAEDNCQSDQGNAFGCGLDSVALEGASAAGDGGFFEDESAPTVVERDVVGSFEFAVLEGGTSEGVEAWLDDNGFAQDDDAGPILDEYLDDGFMFVAFKLRPGAGTDEIHPVVVRYEGDEPCVPLRLTRIAAEEDMGVRVFFLGDHRVVPTNYRHVQINPLQIDWINLGSNYEEVVTLAVDEDGSNGHGFVTEYAGPSAVVEDSAVFSDAWDAEALAAVEPRRMTEELTRQGLISCGFDFDGTCGYQHPLIAGVLASFLPPPAGVSPEDYYLCTTCAVEPDEENWDREGFESAMEERIIAPGAAAREALWYHPYLTRLYTTISPAEMTEDPLFHENEKMPDVSNQWTATRVLDCEGPDHLEFPDGREIWFDEDDVPPRFSDMPMSV